MSLVLFLKSLVAGYTRRDGTVVAPHSDKRTKRSKAAPGQLALFEDEKKPIPPTPLKGLDPVKATPDLFEAPKPADAPNYDTMIKIAADSIEQLRASDVDRVLEQNDARHRAGLAAYISEKRPDLAGDVSDVMEELDAKPAPAPTAKTDTPAFKKWFGDSKVVDGSGKPLVLYHGTMADFSTFDPQAKRKDGNKRTTINSGMFLSKSKEFASGYANREGGNVMPVYAKVTNPFDWKNEEHIKIALDAYEKRFGEPMFDSYAAELKKRGWWASLEGELVNILIRDHGFDGIWMTEGGETNLYVPNSNQIKSATGNNGDYSDHGDITKAVLFLKTKK